MKLLVMRGFTSPLNVLTGTAGIFSIMSLLSGCATPGQTAGAVAGGIVGVTTVGAYKVGPEIQQVYYLGMYDSKGQVPTQMYRVTVHGQASFIGGATFASGWVPAALVDTLECQISSGSLTENSEQQNSTPILCSPRNSDKPSGNSKTKPPTDPNQHPSPHTGDNSNGASSMDSSPSTGFWALGPEALRKVPKDHRLVIVMGMDADAFFQEVDRVLGNISSQQTHVPLTADQKILIRNGLTQTKNARTRIEEFGATIKEGLKAKLQGQ